MCAHDNPIDYLPDGCQGRAVTVSLMRRPESPTGHAPRASDPPAASSWICPQACRPRPRPRRTPAFPSHPPGCILAHPSFRRLPSNKEASQVNARCARQGVSNQMFQDGGFFVLFFLIFSWNVLLLFFSSCVLNSPRVFFLFCVKKHQYRATGWSTLQ